jgi:hypothetical protein
MALVNKLAARMDLRTIDMVRLLGVSRMAYNRWTRGECEPRPQHVENIRQTVKDLMGLVLEQKWPPQDVVGMTGRQRYGRLLELLGRNG